MKVIGAGLPRTGTMSTQAALNQLGFRCYHMQDVPRERGHLRAWTALVQEREPLDWHWLFQNYEATVDAPACFYFEELMREFPDAKVLLTVRDPDRWYDSVTALMDAVRPIRPLTYVIPRFRQFLKLVDSLTGKFVPTVADRGSSVAAFHRHKNELRSIRLRMRRIDRPLNFAASWYRPLCDFNHATKPDARILSA